MLSISDLIFDEKRQKFNKQDWRIEGLPRIILPIRIINVTGLGLGPSLFAIIFLFIMEKLLIGPALKRSLRQMEIAERSKKVAPILCDEKARREMRERIKIFKNDLENSQSLSCFGKLFNYYTAFQSLTRHRSLLELGQEAYEEKVVTPVFIASLPRTGSTILHRLMALDRKRWRTFDFCDQMLPFKPVPRNDEKGRRKLAKVAYKFLNVMELLFPGWNSCMASVHALGPDKANEDHIWYNYALGYSYSLAFMTLHQEERAKATKKRGFESLYSKENATYRYAWIDLVLRIYQHAERTNGNKGNGQQITNENIPWLLKDPRHAFYLPEIIKQFPDAKLIFTHRPPRKLIPSTAKLLLCNTCMLKTPGATGTSSKEWGKEVLWFTELCCESLVTFTEKQEGTDLGVSMMESDDSSIDSGGQKSTSSSTDSMKSDRRIDIRFGDFVKDIPGTIVQIYKQLFPNLPGPTQEILEKMDIYMAENREKSSQSSKLEDFSISESDLEFSRYYINMFC